MNNDSGGRRMQRLVVLLGAACSLATAGAHGESVAAAGAGAGHGFEVPAWLFPIPLAASASTPDSSRLLHVPESDRGYTQAQLKDFYAVADWHDEFQPPVPDIVAHGRKPDVYACSYCHLPDGAGRPENATVAGLPADYIVQQMRDFASGARRTAWTGADFLPATLMAKFAHLTTAQEVGEAAAYFSSAKMTAPRARVIETERVPKTRPVAYVYAAAEGGGDEPLGTRLIEMPGDFERHELRDSRAEYVTYVPLGSIERGRRIALQGTGVVPSCAGCHDPDLRGSELAPPIAGRSPTYLLRQLVALRTGARLGAAGAPMQPVVDALTLEEMIAAAAYAGSLPP
jgi:cytochrome c553